MRLVLSDYLVAMKEDGELDSFLVQLLLSMKRLPIAKIQKGRQYGVDIPAVGEDADGVRKLFLYVVKRGNFSRKNWDTHENDIRPSINEILDVFLKSRVPKPYDQLPVKIIVCCNGEMETAVLQNWSMYVNEHTTDKITFDFWGIHHLVDYADRFQMQEETLSEGLLLNFRRALLFLDLPDYNLSHLYAFLNDLLADKSTPQLTDRQVHAKLRLLNLCMGIVQSWCQKSGNLKPSYIASERIVLATANWIKSQNLIERKDVWKLFYAIIQNWRRHCHEYIDKTYKHFSVRDGLSLRIPSHEEYCLVTYEQIGILSTIGILELWECSLSLSFAEPIAIEKGQQAFASAEAIANILVNLINNNPSSLNPKYDEHCIEINLGLVLLYEAGLFREAFNWLKGIMDRLSLNITIADFFPLYDADPQKLLIERVKDQKSSFLCNFLAEWCLNFRKHELYKSFTDLLNEKLPEVNHQLWFPDKETERSLYAANASDKNGSTMIGIKFPKDPLIFEMHIAEERAILNEEKNFFYNKQGFSFLPFISSRHFRTYPFPNSWRCYLNSKFCFNTDTREEQTDG